VPLLSRAENYRRLVILFKLKMLPWTEKLKFVLVAGVGFFTDGYINLTIGLGMCCPSSCRGPFLRRLTMLKLYPSSATCTFKTTSLLFPRQTATS
jgi:hypothetical protein